MAENSHNPSTPNPPNQDNSQRGLLGRRRDLMSPTARLPSIRTPRDLMLKGAVKKTFKPNIPVRRERTKEDVDGGPKSSSPTPSKRARGRGRGRGREGSRGRGSSRGGRNRQQDLIQTHNSIFEEGPGEKLVRRSTTEGFGRSTASKVDPSSSSTLASSFRSLSLKRSERDKEDSKNIAELLRDDFLKDSSLAVDDKFRPVCLPLKSVSKSSSSSSSASSLQDITEDAEPGKIKIKEEPLSPGATVKVKQEPPDSDDEMNSIDSKDSLVSKLAPSLKDPESKKSLLPLFSRRDHMEGKLLFFQLPDSLPALAPSGDDNRPRVVGREGQGTGGQAEDQANEIFQVQDEFYTKSLHVIKLRTNGRLDLSRGAIQVGNVKTECTLEDLPAGFLGKLRIRKSGKTELKLGSVTLDVSVGTPCGFLQDIVSVRKVQDHHEMINLGQVKHRIVCTPNLLSLLKDR